MWPGPKAEEENKRLERMNKMIAKTLVRKARSLFHIEKETGHSLNEEIRKKYMPQPRSVLEKIYVRISLDKLYKRYSYVRLKTLRETLHIIEKHNKRPELLSEIKNLIIKESRMYLKENTNEEEK